MLNQDERHPGIGWKIVQQLRERFEAAGRRADPDYGKSFGSHRGGWFRVSRRVAFARSVPTLPGV